MLRSKEETTNLPYQRETFVTYIEIVQCVLLKRKVSHFLTVSSCYLLVTVTSPAQSPGDKGRERAVLPKPKNINNAGMSRYTSLEFTFFRVDSSCDVILKVQNLHFSLSL